GGAGLLLRPPGAIGVCGAATARSSDRQWRGRRGHQTTSEPAAEARSRAGGGSGRGPPRGTGSAGRERRGGWGLGDDGSVMPTSRGTPPRYLRIARKRRRGYHPTLMDHPSRQPSAPPRRRADHPAWLLVLVALMAYQGWMTLGLFGAEQPWRRLI